jgi:UDP-arabinose 4-epimerase
MMNVLVTGGAGYIGSHACKALAAAGYSPVTVDNLSRGHEWAVQWGEFFQADLSDTRRLREVFETFQPAAVIHFAAYAYVGESMADPFLYYRNNVAGTLDLLEVMRSSGCDKIVFSSTCATYGTPTVIPITELAEQRPVNPYGAGKLMIEQVLSDADRAYGLRSVCLRYFNAAGADPDGLIGEAHDPEPHLIPLALRSALGQGPGLQVFGDDYDTPDGSCVRDYVHVSDLADAHVLALLALLEGGASDAFNLGNGIGYSVLDVIRTVETVTGRKVEYSVVERRPGDPATLVASAEKASRVLGWAPRHAALEAQVRDAWSWMQHGAKNYTPTRR